MRVKDLMHTAVFTVSPQDPVDRVFFLIHYEKIRHLPVVEKGQVVGIVSDRDLYKALGPRSRSRMVTEGADRSQLYVIPKKARHIMRRGVITIEPEDFASRAASLMARRKVGALPVVQNGRLVGIITATDLLAAFARMTAPSAAAC
jgi:acetoin utilization protein AcuB